jgi:integrase
VNDRQIAAIKPTDSRKEINLKARSLYLVVQPSGTKSFQFRPRIGGKLVRKTLGTYPQMTLREAKAAADRLRGEIEQARMRGEAPKKVLKPKPTKSGAMTVSAAWSLYMEQEGNSRKASPEWWRIFRKDIEPHLGATSLDEVDRDDIETLLLNKAKKAPVASNTIHERLNRFFNWCAREGHALTRLKVSPMANVAKVGSNGKRHDRSLDEQELKWFFRCVDEAGHFQNGFIAALYTGQRLNQVFEATRAQLDGDILTINLKDPRRDQEVTTTPIWLHPDVMKLIAEETDETQSTDPLFTGRTDDTGKALARVEDAMKELAAVEGKTVEHFVPKTLRKTMSNWMGDQTNEDDEPLINTFTIERCLSHVEKSIRAKHYSKNLYLKSKKRAWRLWGDYLSTLRK